MNRLIYALVASAMISLLLLAEWLWVNHRQTQAESLATELSKDLPRLATKAETAPRHNQADLSALKNMKLIGAANSLQTTASDADLPKTTLKLRLVGAFTTTQPNNSSALISEGQGPAKRIFIGESLGSGATLEEVLADHVVIRRDNQLEALHFGASASSPSEMVQAPTTPVQHPPAPASPRGPLAHAAPAANTQALREQIKRRISEMQQQARTRPESK